MAKRESYIRRALDAVVPRPAQNVYRCGWFFRVGEWSGVRLLSRRGLRRYLIFALNRVTPVKELLVWTLQKPTVRQHLVP